MSYIRCVVMFLDNLTQQIIKDVDQYPVKPALVGAKKAVKQKGNKVELIT